ncbi:hypothetical protein Q8A67_022094 [Cirrhinus molitorella]|uniref:Uncharacterized protein n=1 Tax=Cirrhinus molitorella TaxID=172907 RepID=A0AA88P181_9TELE|nr:hypothetical protein Q8A67_022094 [Cirrhinus molitorella]
MTQNKKRNACLDEQAFTVRHGRLRNNSKLQRFCEFLPPSAALVRLKGPFCSSDQSTIKMEALQLPGTSGVLKNNLKRSTLLLQESTRSHVRLLSEACNQSKISKRILGGTSETKLATASFATQSLHGQ